MGKDHDESVKAREGVYGPLDWFLRVNESEKGGECLFGRQLALFDHVTENLSLLQVYADRDNRATALARIGRWLDGQSKRVKQAYSRICLDCKGMGREQILTDDFDLDLMARWYALQTDAMAASDLLRRVLHRVWGGDVQDMIESLSMPGRIMQSLNTWLYAAGQDVCSCVLAGYTAVMRTDDGYRLMTGEDWDNRDLPEKFEDYANVREDFTAAWKAKEDELLALPSERRDEVWQR